MLQWGDVPDFIASIDVALRSCERLQLLCRTDKTNLMTELAVTIDAGESFVKACYTLEDSPLALSCYEVLSTVKALIQVKHWGKTHAVAWKCAVECQLPAVEQQLMTYALTCVQPGFT